MAKQTINIGASPNDGTGTPLRTAFDYTNQNFTELYTALGGGSGLPGASSQVIFNDGGTNLAGDSGLTFNKTTDLLTTGLLRTLGDTRVAEVGIFYVGQGLTPELKVDTSTGITSINGSATITGDLTVDTSTLKVDSANNKVGIGTTTLASTLTIRGTLQTNADYNLQSYYKDNGSTWLGYHLFRDDGVNYLTVLSAQPWAVLVNGSERYRLASDGVATWSNVGGVASTAMTLNANGLGIGVTPSAWGAAWAMLQTKGGSFGSNGTNSLYLNNNAYYDGTNWKYIISDYATRTAWLNGQHHWYTAPSGTAGQTTTVTSGNSYTITAAGGTNYTTFGAANNNVGTTFTATSSGTGNGGGVTQNITFTQAMTLDASGRLILLASTTTPATLSTNGQLTFTATSDTNLRFSYRGSDGVTRVANITLA